MNNVVYTVVMYVELHTGRVYGIKNLVNLTLGSTSTSTVVGRGNCNTRLVLHVANVVRNA
jgi:hypothetical protein